MRDTLVLLTVRNDHEEMKRRILGLGENSNDGHFLYVQVAGNTVGIIDGNHLLDEYESEELAEVASRIGEFSPILVEYPDAHSAQVLLAECLPGVSGILDTNYGELLDYAEVLSRISAVPAWTPRPQ